MSSEHEQSGPWIENAGLLASWAYDRLLMNDEQYGVHRPGRRDGGNPVVVYGHAAPGVLEPHFRGEDCLALHPAHGGNAKWLCLEAGGLAAASFAAAKKWHDTAAALGFQPLLEDSDGRGTLRLWLIFAAPIQVARVVAFGAWLTRGSNVSVERYPASAGKGPGVCVRLPGRHNLTEHHSKIWARGAWRSGQAAIDVILNVVGADASCIPAPLPAPAPAWDDGDGPAWFRDPETAPAIVAEMYREHLFRRLTGYYDRRDAACDALDRIDPDVHRKDWIRVGMALKNEFPAGDGWILWWLWSSKGAKYDASSIEETWASFRGVHNNPVTLGTLKYLAGVTRGS